MYLRTTRRKNRDGSLVEYYQLAHNERDPVTRKPIARVIHKFGRADQVDRNELVRLCRSIARVCNVEVVDLFAEDEPLGVAGGFPYSFNSSSIEPTHMGLPWRSKPSGSISG